MSRKWNIFKKKSSKTDSHGTTLVDEEIQFQPAPRLDHESQWGGKNSLSRNPNPQHHTEYESGSSGNVNHNFTTQRPSNSDSSRASSFESNSENLAKPRLQTDIENGDLSQVHKRVTVQDSGDSQKQLKAGSDLRHKVNPITTMSRTSPNLPRAPKKLIKPGDANAPQPQFLTQPQNNNLGISISDEYTDPFDAVAVQNAMKNSVENPETADGYVEPYKAKKMYLDATQTKKLYDDPWDNKADGKQPGENQDYEEPWDNTTLPYSSNKAGVPRLINPKNELEYSGGPRNESGDSSNSSSSTSLAKQRMVRVDSPKQSPRSSPRNSPKLDRRLIRPKDLSDPRSQLYSVHGGGARYKPVDQRLIKAEPSYGERRRNSPSGTRNGSSRGSSGTNSPMSSSRGSLNQSPVCTLVASDVAELLLDDQRRTSSPLVQPMNPSLYLMNKAKSRSLDVRNRQYYIIPNQKASGAIPKSASDDHLVNQTGNLHHPRNNPLHGVKEYEEPWDTAGNPNPNQRPGNMPHIAHSRSRSYELHSFNAAPNHHHAKSYSFEKQDFRKGQPSHMDYEQPWDRSAVPNKHLASMQRFQQRKLELHPSEAIVDQDFDPLLPLERQSWFHGSMTRDEANRKLIQEVEGSYLVRNSESIPNNYSLSLRTNIDTIHMVISRTRDNFWILGEFSSPFHSVPEMVAFYASHRLKINDAQYISLRYPVSEDYL